MNNGSSASAASPAHAHEPKHRAPTLEREVKFVLDVNRTTTAIRLLEERLKPDPKFPVGIVSSIYYDTRDWAYLSEKRNSDFLKTKVRLRWYHVEDGRSENASKSFAEAKFRIGSRRSKTRVKTNFTAHELERIRLESTRLLTVPRTLIAAGANISPRLIPVFVVRYRRRRFMDPATGLRVCIDYEISSPRVNRRAMADSFPCTLPLSVIELKGEYHSATATLRPFTRLGLRKESFSKYYECYKRLTRTTF